MINSVNLRLWSRVRLIQPSVFATVVLASALTGRLTVTVGALGYFASLAVSAAAAYGSPDLALVRESGTGAFRQLRQICWPTASRARCRARPRSQRATRRRAPRHICRRRRSALRRCVQPHPVHRAALDGSRSVGLSPNCARRPDSTSWADAQRALRLTILMAGVVALGMGAVAPVVLGRVLGPEWLGALVPLWILLLGAVMQSVRFTQVSIAGAYNRPGLAAQSEGVAAVITLTTLWPMANAFGLNGAALVSVLAYSTSALLLRRGILRALRSEAAMNDDDTSAGSKVDRAAIKVTYVERRPAPGRHYSIERVFDAVTAEAATDVLARRVSVPRFGTSPSAILRNMRTVRALRSDVIHVTGDIHYVLLAASKQVRRVLTIHDLASLHRTSGWRRLVIERLWFRWPLQQATRSPR